MKLDKHTPRKNAAQAMVEFAIVLPILLLLLYGLLEAGRLLFIYSTIVTASRQAVRYGSATGLGVGAAVPRYQDCAGIRMAAQRADYLNAFDDADIRIYHDEGPDPASTDGTGIDETQYCLDPTDPDDDSFKPAGNNHRLVVEIQGDFNPIVRLVPFMARTVANGNPIEAKSARTILVSISIDVTAAPLGSQTATYTSTPTITLTPSETYTPSATFTASATLQYTLTASNTPPPLPSATATLIPSATSVVTSTSSPTTTPTSVVGCGSIQQNTGSIQISNKDMVLQIDNRSNNYDVVIKDIMVTWNHDFGHDPEPLKLQSARLGNNTFWTHAGHPGQLVTIVPSQTLIIPAGRTIILQFRFDQSYTTRDNTEEILINLSTPGCELYPIYKK